MKKKDMRATAKQLPSGKWRVRLKRNNEWHSFTADTKREAENKAYDWLNYKEFQIERKTVGDCLMEYINSKDNILSPASIRKYKTIYENAIDEISDVQLSEVTEKILQNWINNSTAVYSPKSVKEHYALVRTALIQENVRLNFNKISLPRITKKEKAIPTEEEMAKLLTIVVGTNLELPVTMAITLGLRQEEIAGLKWDDYDGTYLYIHRTLILDANNKYILQERTKSEKSTRKLMVDALLKERLDKAERKSEFISPMRPSSVLKAFKRLCEKNGLPQFTMHAQRHGNASMMLAMGIPDKYAMERLGQSSTNMIKDVYQHIYDKKMQEVSSQISDVFKSIVDTKIDTKDE